MFLFIITKKHEKQEKLSSYLGTVSESLLELKYTREHTNPLNCTSV